MNHFVFFISFPLLVAAVNVVVGKDTERSEPKPGIWHVTEWFVDGRKMEPVTPYKWHFERSDNILVYQVQATGDELAQWYYFTVNPNASPKEISLVGRVIPPREARPLIDAEKRGEAALKGIYRLSGDTLEIYYATDSELPRPTSFDNADSDKKSVRLKLKLLHKLNESDFLPDGK
jgi:uncharacterized protein (TIGR03067 family)